MTTPVRPPVWPSAQPDIRPGRNDARLSAQKAFFEAALAGAPRPQATAAASSASTQLSAPKATSAQAARGVAATGAGTTDRLPPPGSILNILV
jgi:hypothetical protein